MEIRTDLIGLFGIRNKKMRLSPMSRLANDNIGWGVKGCMLKENPPRPAIGKPVLQHVTVSPFYKQALEIM
jgi:hypothetical protein